MRIPLPRIFQYKARVHNAEKLAKMMMPGTEHLKIELNLDDVTKSKVLGAKDPFIRERYLKTVLGIVGRKD